MKIKSCVFFLGILMLISACSKEEVPVNEPAKPKVNFSNLEIGQQTAFVSYESVCSSMDDGFNYLPDTLLLEVIAVEGNEYTLSERFTENSTSYIQGNTQPLEYSLFFEEDFIRIPNRFESALFGFYGNDTLQLNPTQLVDLQQDGCLLRFDDTIFIGNEIGKIKDFTVGGVPMKDKIGVSCVPGWIGQIDAYLIYDNQGLITSYRVQGFDQIIGGWMELERD